jgi:NADPH:quinone reductase-like Zn-dependent oxidoreductase
MRAALYRDMGEAAEVFEVEEVDRPEPGPGEVLVRVHASGVNPTDCKARSGAGLHDGQPHAQVRLALRRADDRARPGGRRHHRCLVAGELTALPVHKFPLADIAAAHQAAESGAVGKVIVTP